MVWFCSIYVSIFFNGLSSTLLNPNRTEPNHCQLLIATSRLGVILELPLNVRYNLISLMYPSLTVLFEPGPCCCRKSYLAHLPLFIVEGYFHAYSYIRKNNIKSTYLSFIVGIIWKEHVTHSRDNCQKEILNYSPHMKDVTKSYTS